MGAFKESVIIPLAIFKKCSYKDETITGGNLKKRLFKKSDDPLLEQQRKLLKNRMIGKKKTNVLTSFADIQPKTKNKNNLPILSILSNIDLAEIPNIKAFLNKLLENNISWDRNGEIIIGNQRIKRSNITKLMQYFSKSTPYLPNEPKPVGTDEFLRVFTEINIPDSWIKLKREINPMESYYHAYPPPETSAREKRMKRRTLISPQTSISSLEGAQGPSRPASPTDDEFSEFSEENFGAIYKSKQPKYSKTEKKGKKTPSYLAFSSAESNGPEDAQSTKKTHKKITSAFKKIKKKSSKNIAAAVKEKKIPVTKKKSIVHPAAKKKSRVDPIFQDKLEAPCSAGRTKKGIHFKYDDYVTSLPPKKPQWDTK